MASTRVALAKGFSFAVVVVLVLVGGYALLGGGVSRAGLVWHLLVLSLAAAGTAGIWTSRYRVALVGTVGMVVAALLQGAQGAFLLGLAALLVVALVLGYSGQTREQLE
jgi:hypothetical protein